MSKYVISTERLGLRNWQEGDIPHLAAMNQNKEVMKYFPSIVSEKDSKDFVKRMQNHFQQHGFCYFATERLDTGEFIGFIGLLHQNYDSHFTPCVDIGWRISRKHWNLGFATEGAKASLYFAFKQLHLQEVYSVAPKINLPSEHVMQKIGMTKVDEFDHPMLTDYPQIKRCVLYLIKNTDGK